MAAISVAVVRICGSSASLMSAACLPCGQRVAAQIGAVAVAVYN
jgi:hypothetical protein